MGGLSSIGNWVGDTIDSTFEAIGDAFTWVGEKVKDAWSSDIGKIALITAAVYFGGWAITSDPSWFMSAAVEGGTVAQGADVLAVATPGAESAVAVEAAGGAGALEATTAEAAFLEPVGTTAGAGMEVGAADIGLSGVNVGEGAGVLDATASWAAENPMMAYGGMMVGGQAVSGYMQGEQMKKMEEQRLAEERAERDRQNVWGVNYAEGGEGIDAGAQLKDLNRSYFDSAAPVNTAQSNYQLPSERRRAGVLDEVTGRANPNQYAHRPGVG